MSRRYEKLGIKQTIQAHWMDYVVRMMLAGLSSKEIRSELNEYLSSQKQSGGTGERGIKTYGMAVGILASWFSPSIELLPLRDDLFSLARKTSPAEWLPLHWAIISASYPFWFKVAKQTGRLLNLQGQVTQPQIFGRLKEQLGDRETVVRNARYTIRSLIAWKVLKDSDKTGCYERFPEIPVFEAELAILMLESALYATADGRATLGALINDPAFFPFRLPPINGDFIAQQSGRIKVVRYGAGDELLRI